MSYEIERRFLPRNNGWQPLVEKVKLIKQGYLARSHGNTLRVRSTLDNKGRTFELEGKGNRSGIMVKEPSTLLTQEEFRQFAALCGKRWVAKKRHSIENLIPGVRFHIDIFCGSWQPLVVIEIEYDHHEDADNDVGLFDWVGEEITYWPDISNYSLAENGLPSYMKTHLLGQNKVA